MEPHGILLLLLLSVLANDSHWHLLEFPANVMAGNPRSGLSRQLTATCKCFEYCVKAGGLRSPRRFSALLRQ